MKAICCVVLAILAVPSPADEPRRWTFTEVHMGTRFKMIVYAADEATASKACRAAFARIAFLDATMSDYKPASELMQLCKKAGGPPVPVSKELFLVLEKSQELARRTDGAFDVTIGPVVREWRLARKSKRLPLAEDIKEALALVGWRNMVLDPKAQTVQLKKEGMRLDLGAIAKGYAADEAIRILREQGLTRALVAAAGDIVAGDPPPGKKGWTVSIAPLADADPDAKPERSLQLANAAVSTSGDAQQYVEIDGKRYSHIVDPKTGIGILGQFSVTVLSRRGIDSDALDTAVAILGPERGLKLIEQTPGTEAVFLRRIDGKEVIVKTKGFPLGE